MTSFDPFFTPVTIEPFSPKISYRDHVLMVGSCFAEHIDRKLIRYKYVVCGNPSGILYNPVSIARMFQRMEEKKDYTPDELVVHDGLYHSMDHHGSFSGVDAKAVIEKINASLHQSREHLEKSGFVFVSLGTSLVHRYRKSGKIAGNNHKIPSSDFETESLTVESCITELEKIYQAIKTISPKAILVWTVSPIRHTKDGLVANQKSKSVMLVAIHEFISSHTDAYYFPAYEIMMDQLRDYRFYARDMIHPSDHAIDIIWEFFAKTYLDPKEAEQHGAMEKVRKAMEHRILHDHQASTKAFAEGQLRNIDYLATVFPDLDWKEERHYFFQMIEPD